MRNILINAMIRKMKEKKRGGKEIMIELGLAIVGVVLLIFFRDKIGDLISTIAQFVTGKIQSIFTTL